MKRKLLFFVICFGLLNPMKSQNPKLDSLRKIYAKHISHITYSGADTVIVKTLQNLCFQYNLISEFDSTIYYTENGLALTNKIKYKLSDKLLAKVLKKNIANALNNCAEAYRYKGDYNKSLEMHLKALKMRDEINNAKGTGTSLTNIAGIYISIENYDKALDYLLRAYKIFDEIGFEKGISVITGNLGIVYEKKRANATDPVLEKQLYEKALEYYLKGLELRFKDGDEKSISGIYNNLALIYWGHGVFISDKKEKAMLLNKSIECFSKALKIDERIKNIRGIGLAKNNVGGVYKDLGKYKLAEKNVLEGLEIFKIIKSRDAEMQAYLSLSDIYSLEKNYELAFKFHQQYASTRDSLINIEKAKSVAEMAEKYESEKKEQQILFLNKDKEKQTQISALETRKKNIIIISIIFGLILVITFSFFLYRRFKFSEKQKLIIEQQKQLVEEHQKEMIDSITYAKRLQKAILPSDDEINKHLPDNFLLYKPKDIVAGDFYWLHVTPNNETVFIAAADSTGHGVPGAMVSVVCSNALNRAVNEFNLSDTGKILDKTRELVLETFAKSGEEIKDGMDISLLAINKNKNQINWSGANNQLWHIKNNNLVEIKADKQPIGKTENSKPFTTHTIELNTGDTFYLMTDGFPDQFGGPKGKKYKYKQLEEMLIENSTKTLEEQKEILEGSFNEWKGGLEQVDDVCIVGIRV